MKMKYAMVFLALCACEPVQTLDEYRPVVDPSRVSSKHFDADLAQCRDVAKTAQADYEKRAQKEANNNLVAGCSATTAGKSSHKRTSAPSGW